MNIRGTTSLIAHLGYPTHTFKAPMIYNPYFESAGIDAVVVPMGCKAEGFPDGEPEGTRTFLQTCLQASWNA